MKAAGKDYPYTVYPGVARVPADARKTGSRKQRVECAIKSSGRS